MVWRQADRTRTLRAGGRRVHQAVYLARARERSAAGRWGPVRRLSDPRQKVGEPRVAVDGAGVAVAAWHWGTGTRAGTPGHVGRVQVAEQPAGRAWTRARSVSTAAACALDTRLPDVAAGPGGAVVWWQCDLPRGRSATVAVSRGTAPGSWGREARLPFDAAGDQLADVAVAGDGTAIALRVAGGAATAWRGAAPLGAPGALDLAPLALPGAREAARGGGRPAVAATRAGGLGAWIAGCASGTCGGLGLAELGAAGAPASVRALGGDPPPRFDPALAVGDDGTAVAVGARGPRGRRRRAPGRRRLDAAPARLAAVAGRRRERGGRRGGRPRARRRPLGAPRRGPAGGGARRVGAGRVRAAWLTGAAAAVLLGAAAGPATAAWGDAERASVGPMTATSPDVAAERARRRGRRLGARARPLAPDRRQPPPPGRRLEPPRGHLAPRPPVDRPRGRRRPRRPRRGDLAPGRAHARRAGRRAAARAGRLRRPGARAGAARRRAGGRS